MILGVRAIAMPLACGNTVILKASEVCPATHGLICAALQDAGLADGVVNTITHDAKRCRAPSPRHDRPPGRAARKFHRAPRASARSSRRPPSI